MGLKLEQISKRFGQKQAVEGLNMTVEPGQIMGLIGQNGAGKTTTFRMILDFIQPDQGQISWQGKPFDVATRAKIGFLPEERGLYQKLSVEEQVLYFAELHGLKRQAARQQLIKWFDRLEVVGKITDKVQTLSKGNAQKVQFITTLIHEPELLILDEPFTGLDPVNTNLLMTEIKARQAAGAAIIFSSHNMDGVEKLSDHLTMLKQGRTVLQGDIQTIKDSFGKLSIYVETDHDLSQIPGVLSIEPQGIGYHVRIAEEAVGQQIFDLVSQSGYVQAFWQSAPSLDEIFRMEVAEHV